MMIILDTSIMQNCDILTTTISQGKEVKGIKIEKGTYELGENLCQQCDP